MHTSIRSLPLPRARPVPGAVALLRATAVQRVLTCLIDLALFAIFVFVCGVSFFVFGAEALFRLPDAVLLGILVLLYYVPQEAASGRTLGKLLARTKAVRDDGSPLSFGRAVVRSVCRLIPFEALSVFGGHGRPRMWHDSLAGTVVVSTR